jgi:iron(III) transport system ATP-binding protein
MSDLQVTGLVKHFGGRNAVNVIDDLDLHVEEGEFLILLGPSGCGKTTTLRCIAGLESPNTGSISFGGRTVFDAAGKVNLAPNKRDVGMVFQSYALWPHMTVRRNIAYPLRARRTGEGQRAKWVEDMAALVDCSALLDRYPSQLSGGQQQRVALARGLVARPALVLFDEPLSNLDARLRDQVRSEIHELHGRLGFTAVFVTHDQAEALALGDRLAVMRAGRLEQYGTPDEVFEHPVSEYVAEFLGMTNQLVCTYDEAAWRVAGQQLAGAAVHEPGPPIAVRLRTEDVHLAPIDAPPPASHAWVRGAVVDSTYGGRHLDVVVRIGEQRVQARLPLELDSEWARRLRPDDDVIVSFAPESARVFAALPTGAAGTVEQVEA